MSDTPHIPKVSNLMEAMKMGKDYLETALYVKTQFRQIVDPIYKKLSPDEKQHVDKMIVAVEKYAKLVQVAHMGTARSSWDGHKPVAELESLQRGLAAEAIKTLGEKGVAKDITLDYAVSDKGHFIRGYSSPEGALPDDSVDSLDQLFNAWLLTEKNIISQDGFLSKDGVPQTKEQVEALIASNDFKKYLDAKGFNLTINTASPYEVSAADIAQAKQAAEKAVASVAEMETEAESKSNLSGGSVRAN